MKSKVYITWNTGNTTPRLANGPEDVLEKRRELQDIFGLKPAKVRNTRRAAVHDTRVDSTLTRSATADAEITAGEHTPAAEASLRASDSPWMDTLDIEDLNDHREPKTFDRE